MHNGILIGYGMLVLGDAVSGALPEIGNLTQVGALGVLAWVAYCQRGEIKAQRDELTEIRREHSNVISTLCNRWDIWEQLRHSDSEKLDDTLRAMTANCAAVTSKRDKV